MEVDTIKEIVDDCHAAYDSVAGIWIRQRNRNRNAIYQESVV